MTHRKVFLDLYRTLTRSVKSQTATSSQVGANALPHHRATATTTVRMAQVKANRRSRHLSVSLNRKVRAKVSEHKDSQEAMVDSTMAAAEVVGKADRDSDKAASMAPRLLEGVVGRLLRLHSLVPHNTDFGGEEGCLSTVHIVIFLSSFRP